MDIVETMKQYRREFHAIPESSGHEIRTKEKIRQILGSRTRLAVEDHNGGIIAYYHVSDMADTIAFRGDFDAVSLPDGSAAHLCGHDGHTSALLGLALSLETIRPEKNVLLIFQHAEETGEGARAMADVLERYHVSEIYGCHNLPGLPFGKIFTTAGPFACASCGLIYHIDGEPAHAAFPETGRSPMRAVGALFDAIASSQSGEIFEEGTFATLIGCKVGQKAFGTSAEKAEVWITVRSRTEKGFGEIREYLENVVKKACEEDGIVYTLETQDEFPATVNDPACADKILRVCEGSGLMEEPVRWSEDFGHFLNANAVTTGAFFGIGAGDCPALHTRDYEYREELLEPTLKAFKALLMA